MVRVEGQEVVDVRSVRGGRRPRGRSVRVRADVVRPASGEPCGAARAAVGRPARPGRVRVAVADVLARGVVCRASDRPGHRGAGEVLLDPLAVADRDRDHGRRRRARDYRRDLLEVR